LTSPHNHERERFDVGEDSDDEDGKPSAHSNRGGR
jgi:carboxypeptidase D